MITCYLMGLLTGLWLAAWLDEQRPPVVHPEQPVWVDNGTITTTTAPTGWYTRGDGVLARYDIQGGTT